MPRKKGTTQQSGDCPKATDDSHVDVETTVDSKNLPLDQKIVPSEKPGANKKLTLVCYDCETEFSTTDLNIDQPTYSIIQSVSDWGSRWHCSTCLSSPHNNKAPDQNNIERQMEKLNQQISNLTNQMQNLTNAHEKLEQTSLKMSDAADTLTSRQGPEIIKDESKLSWADITANPDRSNSLISNLAKQVCNNQKKLSVDRDERENNVIIFNSKEKEDNTKQQEEDVSFFTSICNTLGIQDTPEVKLIRIGEKKPKHPRPIKAEFTNNWDKRKFLSKLYKLKNLETYSNIRIAHDMSNEDREENKRLLDQAYQMNLKEKPTTFRYKVRGPPWAMKITKVSTKN